MSFVLQNRLRLRPWTLWSDTGLLLPSHPVEALKVTRVGDSTSRTLHLHPPPPMSSNFLLTFVVVPIARWRRYNHRLIQDAGILTD